MKIVKRSARARPEISLVLLDWSVRESFQLLHYLGRQTAAREAFEVVVVEYYGRESPALAPFQGTVDTWALLGMPSSCCYNKHVMYNAGIVLARGEVVLFCDSDAMAINASVLLPVNAKGMQPGVTPAIGLERTWSQ